MKENYKHKDHVSEKGPVHRAWNIGRGWFETDLYCVAPSAQTIKQKGR